jgi:glutathione synthase/RimK-type ligase-like ATP-grasp enzyme
MAMLSGADIVQGRGSVKREMAGLAIAAPAAQRLHGHAGAGRPVVLIASTTWWAFPARIAMACAARGMDVDAICGPGHPLQKTASLRRRHPYGALRPLRALEAAITESGACLVLPCDERARANLHLLHMRSSDPAIRRVIERSLGDPAQFAIVDDRTALIDCARALGIAAPETLRLDGEAALEEALSRLGLPAVLKVDGSWGGLGVAVARTRAQAGLHFARLSRPLSLRRAIKRLLVDRDAFHLHPWLAQESPRVCVQRYAPGRPANSVSACIDGEILGTICAEAVLLQRPHGASSVVRIIDNAQMCDAAVKLARHLRLSGVFGLDFLIDDRTGQANLVEMNPRATPLSHLALGPGRDVIGAIGHLAGLPTLADPVRVTENAVIAYFPQALHTAPGTLWLTEGFHDVPWDDPGLTAELMRRPRPDRGLLAGLLRLLRRGAGGDGAVATSHMMDAT